MDTKNKDCFPLSETTGVGLSAPYHIVRPSVAATEGLFDRPGGPMFQADAHVWSLHTKYRPGTHVHAVSLFVISTLPRHRFVGHDGRDGQQGRRGGPVLPPGQLSLFRLVPPGRPQGKHQSKKRELPEGQRPTTVTSLRFWFVSYHRRAVPSDRVVFTLAFLVRARECAVHACMRGCAVLTTAGYGAFE